ncbi:MAG TPA: hypothetical protein VNS79_03715 [Sphingobium sp.]|nr:hypothetical protein [Sphingobium sp.]
MPDEKPVIFDDDNREWTERDFARALRGDAIPEHIRAAFASARASRGSRPEDVFITKEERKKFNNLCRILRAETADHPLIGDAIIRAYPLISGKRWIDDDDTRKLADEFANALEDGVAYRGAPIDDYVKEPWLSLWRRTCHRAMCRAQMELER